MMSLQLLAAVQPLLTGFISRGVESQFELDAIGAKHSQTLIDSRPPSDLAKLLDFDFPDDGAGREGVVEGVGRVLDYSLNPWHQGFLSKLYASPNPVGLISELVLAVLNTNVHVYEVSPALSTVEKAVGQRLAGLFGLHGRHAGGLVQQGGSSANLTALVIARNTMFPDTKTNGVSTEKLALFTSSHGHYSFEKAAQICGLGSNSVWPVDVDSEGRMSKLDLERKIATARSLGFTPFFVNATAGTTVLGSYDPMEQISEVCRKEGLWFHVDASWGGAVVFSAAHRHKMRGAELAQTITYNPHKMLNVTVTCSFLLVADLTQAWRSNTLPASYLFHSEGDENSAELPHDIADMTLQCGRKGDALKLALSWIYYGTRGFESRIDHAFSIAAAFARRVCFYFAAGKQLASAAVNTQTTRTLAKRLRREGLSVDFASGANGMFLRVVVNLETREATIEHLVGTVQRLGLEIAGQRHD